MEPFHVQTIDGADHVTVRIAGDVDMACAESLAEAFGRALATERHIVVDCSHITFLDAAGLTAITEARDVARKYRVGFQLASVPGPVRRVLELSDTTSLFDVANGHAEPALAKRAATVPSAAGAHRQSPRGR